MLKAIFIYGLFKEFIYRSKKIHGVEKLDLKWYHTIGSNINQD